jgi:valyl-tRNA synthetase
MENIQDWCISRQLWWGHRIPVWYRKDRAEELQGAESLDKETAGEAIHVGLEPPSDPDNWVQDEDVLDTWFSSWLWPFATMDEDTRMKFYPTTDLVTGPDILFFWVARMIMAGYEFTGERPFANVFFTSIIRDKLGRKMSKSLGNSPDPLDLIAKFGADALRFTIMRIAPSGSDVRFIENKKKDEEGLGDTPQVDEGRNFANKLWNACRFRQMVGEAGDGSGIATHADTLSIYDLDILAKLDTLATDMERGYEGYKFQELASKLYDFFWSGYCDWYLESIKGHTRPDSDAGEQARTLAVIDTVLARFVQLLQPFMPHITEELWEKLGFAQDGELLMRTPLPEKPVLDGIDPERIAEAQARVIAIAETTTGARHLKAQYQLAGNKNVKFILDPEADWASEELETLKLLCGAGEIDVQAEFLPPAGMPTFLTPIGKMYMPLDGLVDLDAEKERITKELGKVEKDLKAAAAKLANANFTERAPKEVVDEIKQRRESLKIKREQLQEMLANLS